MADGIEALIHTLKHSSSSTTPWLAAEDLHGLDPIGKLAVSALIEALVNDQCPHVRLAAAVALAAIGPVAGPAKPALLKVLRDAQLLCREIEQALHQLDAAGDGTLPVEIGH